MTALKLLQPDSLPLDAVRRRLADVHPQRIAILKPSAIGDIAHALPVATGLRQRFPNAELTWIINDTYRPLLESHPDLDDVISFDRARGRSGWFGSISSFCSFLRQLRRRRFDLIIDLQGLLRSGLMAQATGAKYRLGLASAREGARWFYNVVLPDDLWNMHAVDRYWLAAQAFGIRGPKQFRFPPLDRERNTWLAKLASWPRPWVMMNLGTRWETKRWPVSHFATVAQQVHLITGGSVILVGGPDEHLLAAEFEQKFSRKGLSTVGKTTLRELVAILSLSDLVVSNDSGPLHLAAALGRPVLAPFTCTSPTRTGPYGQRDNIVMTTVPCAASYLKTCSSMVCMQELTPDRLVPTLNRLLQTWQRSSA
jgi:lipopolysaccharide heptosyltransferase I